MSFTSSRASLAGNRDFVVAVAARALSLFGDLVTVVTLTLLLQSRGERPIVIAALFAAGLLPMVLLSSAIGRMVDARDSRRLLVAAGFGAAIASVGVAYAPSTTMLLVLVGAVGVMTGVLNTTWSALVPSIVGRERIARASGVNQAASAVAMLSAPAFAGLLTGWVGFHIPVLVDAATFAVISLAALTIRTRRRPEPTVLAVHGGWAVLRADRVLRAAISLLASFVVLANCINIIDVYLVRDTLGLSTTWFGLFGAAWGAGAIVGAALASRAGSQKRLVVLLLVGCALIGGAAVCLGLARNAAWLLPIGIAGGFGNGWTNSAANALTMLRTPEPVRGRVSAAIGAVMGSAQLLAYAVGAALSTVLSPRPLLLLVGVVGLAVVLAWIRPLWTADRPRITGSSGPRSSGRRSPGPEPLFATPVRHSVV